MTRPKITVLCEDKQHESFIRRFLKKRNRQIYAVCRPKDSSGAGDQFVRDHYPIYLDAIRKRGGVLVAMKEATTGMALRGGSRDERG